MRNNEGRRHFISHPKSTVLLFINLCLFVYPRQWGHYARDNRESDVVLQATFPLEVIFPLPSSFLGNPSAVESQDSCVRDVRS